MSFPNISGSTSQTASSGSTGGALDTQGKYTFGGISTGGGTQSYVAMGLVALVAIAALILALKR
jgi:hypothetical protein